MLGSRVHGKVITAKPFDRNDFTLPQQLGGRVHRVSIGASEPQARPAVAAAQRLRVEAAIRRIVILPPAWRAHHEA